MAQLNIDKHFLLTTLTELVSIPSPSGYTDQVVHYAGETLNRLDIPFELTRRGAIRATISGKQKTPDRAVVSHLDTLGAMVKRLKENGRLQVVPIGTWSSRFAEGARVTVFTDNGPKRGTILPLKSSGHTYNLEIDTQPVTWEQVEVRVDEDSGSITDLISLGFNVGDFIAIDPSFELTKTGYINSRHLDNKAGVATILAAAKAVVESTEEIAVDCHLLFTISEEVGSGASAILHGDVAEMVSIDNSTVAPGQMSTEKGVTVGIKDSSGPFDYHLTKKILKLCEDYSIPHARDVFRWYKCDAASALAAGNDIRTALVCFGCDSSHGYERTHVDSLVSLASLLVHYIQSQPTFQRDQSHMGSLRGFPTQPLPKLDETSVEDTVRPDSYDDNSESTD